MGISFEIKWPSKGKIHTCAECVSYNQGCGAGAGLFWVIWSRSREFATVPAPDQA